MSKETRMLHLRVCCGVCKGDCGRGWVEREFDPEDGGVVQVGRVEASVRGYQVVALCPDTNLSPKIRPGNLSRFQCYFQYSPKTDAWAVSDFMPAWLQNEYARTLLAEPSRQKEFLGLRDSFRGTWARRGAAHVSQANKAETARPELELQGAWRKLKAGDAVWVKGEVSVEGQRGTSAVGLVPTPHLAKQGEEFSWHPQFLRRGDATLIPFLYVIEVV